MFLSNVNATSFLACSVFLCALLNGEIGAYKMSSLPGPRRGDMPLGEHTATTFNVFISV